MSISFKQLPGPKGLPLIGCLHRARLSSLHTFFEESALEFGDIYKVRLGLTGLTVIAQPELIQKILKSRPLHFRRASKLDEVMRREDINGLFNAEGEDWKVHRRIVTRGLDIKHLQKFFPAMSAITGRFHQNMENAARSGKPYRVQEDLLKYTVDVTTSLAFGIDMNTLQQSKGTIQDQMEKIFPMIFRRINSPFAWYKYYSTSKDHAFEKALRTIEMQIDEFIEVGRKRIALSTYQNDKPENILDALLIAAEEEETITDREIKSNLLTLLMAGEDTTAHSLAWAIYMICKHPEVQQKLKEESHRVLKGDNYLREYSEHQLLIYTNAVIQETLRLKAVAPVMLAEPIEDIELDGYRFTKGSRLVLLTRSSGMREEHFSSAHLFNPDRWLMTGQCPVHVPDSMMPFGHGPRLCPGKNLAILEMKLVLSMIAKNFSLELTEPGQNVKENMAFTMMPDDFTVDIKRSDS